MVKPDVQEIGVGTEVKYGSFEGGVTVTQSNADGTYIIDIPGVGAKAVLKTDIEYYVACCDLKVVNVNFPALTGNAALLARFKEVLQEGIASAIMYISPEAGTISTSQVATELYQTCERHEKRWYSAVLVRAIITPPTGVTAGRLVRILSAAGVDETLAQMVTTAVTKGVAELPSEPNWAVSAAVKGVAVATNKAPAKVPQLCDGQPVFRCWYYNEDDPRGIVCGSDEIQCEQPSVAPNLATLKGKLFCCLMMPYFLIALPLTPCRAMV
jgi:hypothetical protein